MSASILRPKSSVETPAHSGRTPGRSGELSPRQFTPRSLLPLKTDCLWKIDAGVVRTITFLEDGASVTLGVCGPGDVVGQPLAGIEPFEIECLTKVEAHRLPPELWHQDLPALVAYVQQAQALMLIRSYRKVDVMLLKLFSWLATRFGRQVETGQLIDLRLTHQDIAEILGTTRVTITRVLSQLEQQGLIHRLPVHRIVLKEYEVWHYEI